MTLGLPGVTIHPASVSFTTISSLLPAEVGGRDGVEAERVFIGEEKDLDEDGDEDKDGEDREGETSKIALVIVNR